MSHIYAKLYAAMPSRLCGKNPVRSRRMCAIAHKGFEFARGNLVPHWAGLEA